MIALGWLWALGIGQLVVAFFILLSSFERKDGKEQGLAMGLACGALCIFSLAITMLWWTQVSITQGLAK